MVLHLRQPLLAVAAAAFLIGCAGASDSTGSVAASADEPTEQQVSPDSTTDSTTGSSDSPPESLDDYLGGAVNLVRGGGGGGAAGFDEEQLLEEQRLIQQEIQACMQSQGFTYAPEEVGTGFRFFLASESEGISAESYAETQGFGISTRFDSVREGDVDLTESASPNDEHVATLSGGEADAWQIALRGVPPQRNDQGQLIDPETGEVLQGGGRGGQAAGCTGDAQTAVRGDFTALAELADEFEELDARIEADARITEIRRDWVDCMRADGFDFADEAEARQSINTQVRPLLRSFFQGATGVDGADGEGVQGAGRGQGGGNQLQAIAGLELTAEQEAELETLQDLERSTAAASLLCHGGTQEEVAEITLRYEMEFVDTNRAALEAIAG